MSAEVAERWGELEPVWRWKMRSSADIRATGFHIKATLKDIYGTYAYDRAVNGYRGLYTLDWQAEKKTKKFGGKTGLGWFPVDALRRSE
jgi:hypothetical protein